MIFRNNFKLIYLVAVNKELKLWRNNEKDNHKGFSQMNYCFSDLELTKTFPYSERIISKILNMRHQQGNVRLVG